MEITPEYTDILGSSFIFNHSVEGEKKLKQNMENRAFDCPCAYVPTSVALPTKRKPYFIFTPLHLPSLFFAVSKKEHNFILPNFV